MANDSEQIASWQPPPTTVGGILARLGPGLIIAGSIVGSGELIATTKTGAEAGFVLLWLILIGCVIKVFAQIEFGRYSISTGRTTMDGMNELPGPRLRAGWLVWYWLVMQAFGLAQLGGIVGSVGVSMAISLPITGDFNRLIADQREWDRLATPIRARLAPDREAGLASPDRKVREAALSAVNAEIVTEIGEKRPSQKTRRTHDDLIWAGIITVITAVMLVIGRYGLVQNVSVFLVAGFTVVTIWNLAALQVWGVNARGVDGKVYDLSLHWADIREGLSFGLPASGLATALATFGIIGVGASEFIAYPYWCLEKGYARFTGPREESPAWAERARGWLRVMRWDAWCSMVIYTLATLAFYLLGAAVLHRQGLNPASDQLIPVLAEMYGPVFGTWAPALFLFGAFAVLYSTFFVATAGNARVSTDALRIFGLRRDTERSKENWVRFLCGFYPFFSLSCYYFYPDPTTLVLASGVSQAVMLPLQGFAALFFRYRRADSRICPGRIWDAFLWISVAGLAVAGSFGGWTAAKALLRQSGLLE